MSDLRRWRVHLGVFLGGAGVMLALGASTVHADSEGVPVDRQGYVATTAADPCQGTTSDVCVAAVGADQQTLAVAYAHIEFSHRGQAVIFDDLVLELSPSANGAGNTNSSSAALTACVLTKPLPDAVTASTAPPADCSAAAAPGVREASGVWSFELRSFLRAWDRLGNTGLEIMPAPPGAGLPPVQAPPGAVPSPPALPPGSVQPPVPVPAAWSVAFNKAVSRATVVYHVTVEPPAAQSGAGAGSDLRVTLNVAPGFAPVGPVAPVAAAPAPSSAPAPIAEAPNRTVLTVAVIRLRRSWLNAALALLAGAVGLLLGSAMVVARSPETRNRGIQTIAAELVHAHSRMAGPILVLLLAAALAMGSVAQVDHVLVTVK